jgi:hypothetical protein
LSLLHNPANVNIYTLIVKNEEISMADKVITHPGFRDRIAQACDNNPHVPPLNHGRLTWVVTKLKENFGVSVSVETVRRWFSGEALPRQARMRALAELLSVDTAWLALGHTQTVTAKEQKLREAELDGAVNLVAGAIQMNGVSPAFPLPDDKQAAQNLTDIFAIVRGAQYALHVITSNVGKDGEVNFNVPLKAVPNNRIIAVVSIEPLSFECYEVPVEVFEAHGKLTNGAYRFSAPLGKLDEVGCRKIETFGERLL